VIRNKYSVAEAAALIGIGPWTLRRLETMGRIPQARRDPLWQYRVYDDTDIARAKEAIERMGERATTPIPA